MPAEASAVAELAGLPPVLDARIERELSAFRAKHSRGVAELAAELCGKNGIDPLRGRIAGLAHDLCKELPVGEQRRLAKLSGYFGGHADELTEELLHGPAAAYVLMQDYGFGPSERDIVDSVAYHTVGRPGMTPLDIFIYVADKIEPGRAHVDASFRERCLSLPPEGMLLAVMENTMSWLKSKGRAIAPETLLLYNSLRKSVPSR